MSLKKDTSPELISDSSKITFDNANQLSTRKADDDISTSSKQIMIENLNSAGHDTKVGHIGFEDASIELSLLPESFESTRDGGRGTTLVALQCWTTFILCHIQVNFIQLLLEASWLNLLMWYVFLNFFICSYFLI